MSSLALSKAKVDPAAWYPGVMRLGKSAMGNSQVRETTPGSIRFLLIAGAELLAEARPPI